MIIDSPIVSGSFLSTGSLSQIGNAQITGSLTVSGSSISLVGGSFSGSGANLFGIPSTGITGLNLSQISSGSVSASISPNLGLLINTRVSASNFTGSFTGSLTGIATSASYAAFALTSSYSLGGSGFPFSGSAVITGSLIVSGSRLTITGSLAVSTLTTGSGVRYVIADANGLISAQTASAAIFTTQQNIATANQTVFPITNGYITDYLTVFVNGTKLNNDEFTDTDGVNVTFLTGSTAGDIVEFVKYMPAAGVSNNSLRTVNYFTATLGQTNFNVNYTPGLLDVFYNGSKLDNTDYTAANGTSITLATASNAGDRIEVDVYSYQVGAFSGIGGSGAANQLAYFNTSNSITGSNNFVVSGSSIIVTGSLIVSGSGTLVNIGPAIFSGSVTSTGGFSGSFTGSFFGSANSSSLAANSLLLSGTGSVGFTTTGSFTTMSSSLSTRTTQIEQVYATTGSNSFRATQSITGSLTVTGQIIAQTINVQQVTSSIIYSSGSNVFGCDINSRQTFTGSFYQTGSVVSFTGAFSGSTGTFSCHLGVGTSNPQSQLVVARVGNNATLELNVNNVGYSRIFSYDRCATTSTNLVLQDPGGNVGIGNTSPTYSFDICTANYRSMRIQSSDDALITMGSTLASSQFYSIGVSSNVSGQGSNLFWIGTSTNNPSGTLTKNLVITCAGNVGIGTSSPVAFGTRNLDVNAGAGSAAYIVARANSNAGTMELAFDTDAGYLSTKSNHPLLFRTNDIVRMRIHCGGNITMGGTCDSGDRLRVEGSVFATSNVYTSNEGTGFMIDANTAACNARVGFMKYPGLEGMLVSGNTIQVRLGHRTDSNFVSGGSPTIRVDMAITPDGQVFMYYLGASAGTHAARYSTSTGQLTYDTSSCRYKNNIRTSTYGLSQIMNLRSTMFEYKEDDRTDIGLIAEEVYEVIPELVSLDKEQRPNAVSYDRLVSVLIKGMQEQQCKIALLESCLGIS